MSVGRSDNPRSAALLWEAGPAPEADASDRVAREQAALLEIGRLISSTLVIDEVYERFAQHVNELIPFDRIIIAEADPAADTVNPLYVAGLEMGGPGRGEERSLSATPFHQVVTERSTLILDGPGSDEALKRFPWEIYGKTAGLRSLIGTPLITNDEVIGLLIIRSREEHGYSEVHARLAEAVATQIAGAIAASRLYARAQKQVREREILAELARIISSSLEINEVYDQFATRAQRLIPFDRIVIASVDTAQGTISPVYIAGLQIRGWGVGTTHTFSETPVGPVLRGRRASLFTSRDSAGALHSGIAVPLTSRDRVIGALVLSSFDPDAYSDDDVRLSMRIAERVAPALQNALAYQQSREIAVLEERNRIAREIHDSLAQGLTAIIWQLNAAQADVMEKPEFTAEQLEKIRDLARECLKEARRSVLDLRSGPLRGRTLPDALRDEARGAAGAGRTQVRFATSGRRRALPSTTESGVLRVCQEALNNVRKHSAAVECVVELNYRHGSLELIVRDDGRGFDPESPSRLDESGGFGLISMRERTRLLGGELAVVSDRGRGTSISAVFPTR